MTLICKLPAGAVGCAGAPAMPAHKKMRIRGSAFPNRGIGTQLLFYALLSSSLSPAATPKSWLLCLRVRRGFDHDGLSFAQLRFGVLQLRFHPLPGAGALVEFAEDHFAGSGLENRGHGDVDVLADELARVIHHDHGPIVEI